MYAAIAVIHWAHPAFINQGMVLQTAANATRLSSALGAHTAIRYWQPSTAVSDPNLSLSIGNSRQLHYCGWEEMARRLLHLLAVPEALWHESLLRKGRKPLL